MLTEFGGVSFAPEAGEEWFAYSTVGSPEEFVEKFAELVGPLMDSPVIAGLCWTQLTDTEQEVNGLLTADRRPKAPLEAFRAVLQRPARSLPFSEVDFAQALEVSETESGGEP